MKKIVLILFLAILSIHAFSQKGDLTVGAKGGYVLSNSTYNYRNILYGIDIAYHLSDPLEIAFTGLMNPNIPHDQSKLAIYSANLDFRLYLIHQREWATGPALGGQYYIIDKPNEYKADKALGFNIGWHIRANLTDNVKINGGWRYTNSKAKDKKSYRDKTTDISYHLIYVGVAYTFELR